MFLLLSEAVTEASLYQTNFFIFLNKRMQSLYWFFLGQSLGLTL